MQLPNKPIVLFDGVCNLCNSSVKYIIKHDKLGRFVFAPLQSKTGQYIVEKFKIDTSKTDSVMLYTLKQGVLLKSTAALYIALGLGFPNSIVGVFFIIPPFIRNWIYDYIARNRYRWFGKKNSCMVPSQEIKDRFLD
jgi:predicted DCC family thiol-disulfide oxidoreductase YuxK